MNHPTLIIAIAQLRAEAEQDAARIEQFRESCKDIDDARNYFERTKAMYASLLPR